MLILLCWRCITFFFNKTFKIRIDIPANLVQRSSTPIQSPHNYNDASADRLLNYNVRVDNRLPPKKWTPESHHRNVSSEIFLKIHNCFPFFVFHILVIGLIKLFTGFGLVMVVDSDFFYVFLLHFSIIICWWQFSHSIGTGI